MDNSSTYSVVSSGQVQSGFDSAQVQTAFAKLFKIDIDKANGIVGTKKILKKGLNLEKANLYKNKLENIGLVVALREQPVTKEASAPKAPALSLEPTAEEKQQAEAKRDEVTTSPTADPNTITCPKCNLQQPKTEECAGCGIFIHKYRAPQQAIETTTPNDEVVENEESSEADTQAFPVYEQLNIPALAAAAGAAIVGAFIWKIIATVFGYELGLVAWGIGGAVGFAAVAMGAHGQTSGIVCGALALVAILGGKYMAVDSIQSQLQELLTAPEWGEELRVAYAEEQEIAQQYVVQVTDEASLRQFIFDYGYSFADEASGVSSEEINDFKEYVDPELRALANDSLSYDEWINNSATQVETLSTLDLMTESLGLLDILFLVFGVGTAFKLGSGYQREAT